MNINIALIQGKTTLEPVTFEIREKALIAAVKVGYLSLGTPYDPISIDNFVILGANEFPTILNDTQISISLKPSSEDKGKETGNLQLICCRVKNVGKLHNDHPNSSLENSWHEIFDYNPGNKHIKTVPDGALYISPNDSGVCQISTCKKVATSFLSYSMLFCLTINYESGIVRTYYFNLDPVVEISSNRNP